MYLKRKPSGFQLRIREIKHNAYRPRYKIYNRNWELDLYDIDDHPSVPHAHSINDGVRLNVWTGEVYPPGSDRVHVIGRVPQKELKVLYHDKKFIQHAIDHIQWYRETHPKVVFYIPDWFKHKHLMNKYLTVKRDNTCKTYTFTSTVIFSAEYNAES